MGAIIPGDAIDDDGDVIDDTGEPMDPGDGIPPEDGIPGGLPIPGFVRLKKLPGIPPCIGIPCENGIPWLVEVGPWDGGGPRVVMSGFTSGGDGIPDPMLGMEVSIALSMESVKYRTKHT